MAVVAVWAGSAGAMGLVRGGDGKVDPKSLIAQAESLAAGLSSGTVTADACERAKKIKSLTDRLPVKLLSPDIAARKEAVDALLTRYCPDAVAPTAPATGAPAEVPAWAAFYNQGFVLYVQVPGQERQAMPTNTAIFWLPVYTPKPPPPPPETKAIPVDPVKAMQAIAPTPATSDATAEDQAALDSME